MAPRRLLLPRRDGVLEIENNLVGARPDGLVEAVGAIGRHEKQRARQGTGHPDVSSVCIMHYRIDLSLAVAGVHADRGDRIGFRRR
jgi:hypothetical protein